MQRIGRQIDAVVFDIGRVLIDFDFERAFSAASKMTGIAPGEIRSRLFGVGDFAGFDRERAVVAFECGRISEREFHASVEKALGRPIPFEHFCELWNCIYTGEIESTVKIMRVLQNRASLRVGVLSNTNALHMNHLRPRMKCLEDIEHVYCSHEIGWRKPDPESYLHVLECMNVRAEHTVFVDDLSDNVAAAEALGMIGVHATSSTAVRVALFDLGLLE